MSKLILPVVPAIALLVGCVKELPMSKSSDKGTSVSKQADEESPVAGQNDKPPKKKEYLTLPEKDLQGIARTNQDHPNPTEAQLARKARNIAIIKKMGLPTLESLPVVEDDAAVKLRTPQEVAKRCIATVICAAKGESNDQELVDNVIKDYAAQTYFSPQEKQFIGIAKPEKQQLLDFCWRYECAHVFLWALGLREDLVGPNEICNVSEDVKLLKKKGGKDLVANAKLRSAAEILEMNDLYYRLHWAAIQLRIKDEKSDKVDEEIIRERHRALNWLIHYLNQEWDDVTTDT
jgi:hypothetical protein